MSKELLADIVMEFVAQLMRIGIAISEAKMRRAERKMVNRALRYAVFQKDRGK